MSTGILSIVNYGDIEVLWLTRVYFTILNTQLIFKKILSDKVLYGGKGLEYDEKLKHDEKVKLLCIILSLSNSYYFTSGKKLYFSKYSSKRCCK